MLRRREGLTWGLGLGKGQGVKGCRGLVAWVGVIKIKWANNKETTINKHWASTNTQQRMSFFTGCHSAKSKQGGGYQRRDHETIANDIFAISYSVKPGRTVAHILRELFLGARRFAPIVFWGGAGAPPPDSHLRGGLPPLPPSLPKFLSASGSPINQLLNRILLRNRSIGRPEADPKCGWVWGLGGGVGAPPQNALAANFWRLIARPPIFQTCQPSFLLNEKYRKPFIEF